MTRPSSSRATRCQRWLAGSIALVLLVAGVISGNHEATVSHVRCAHGELTHGQAVVANTSGTTAAISVPDSTPPRDEGHEHCALAAAHHVVEQTRNIASAPITVEANVVASVSLSPVAQRDCIYQTAPKTSPPA